VTGSSSAALAEELGVGATTVLIDADGAVMVGLGVKSLNAVGAM